MALEVRVAETDAERSGIFRHRYEVYCEELKQFREAADHHERILQEPVDAQSRQVGGYLDQEVVGSMRWIWGGDAAFAPEHIELYRLNDLLKSVPPEQIVICERIIVSAEHRDHDAISAMFGHLMGLVNAHRIQLIVSACQPHFLNLYMALGFRAYSMENVDNAETGYLVPLVLIAEDVGYLRAINSPIAAALRDFKKKTAVPQPVLDMVASQGTVVSERLSDDDTYWRALQSAYALSGLATLHLFQGLSEDEIRLVIRNSNLIECRANDSVLKRRDVSRAMYVVLSGSLEARSGDEYLATLMPGDVIGEIAFLLSTPRTADVIAMLDGTKLLSLSESTVEDLIAANPQLAAKFLLNVSKLLCAKLAFRVM